MDKGLCGREILGNTPIIYLFNAVDQYHKFDNEWTTGKGKHVLSYSLLPVKNHRKRLGSRSGHGNITNHR